MKKQIWDFIKKGAKNIGQSVGKSAAEGGGENKNEGGKSKKKIMIVIILIPVIFVWIVINIIQALFQAFVCTISFGMICHNKKDKTEDAITDQEIEDIAEKMRTIRAKINAEIAAGGGTPGENYGSLSPGGFEGSDYNTSCGPYTGENADVINRSAQKNNVEPQLVAAVAKKESQIKHFKPDGTVIRNKASGATGMMQLMPATAAWLHVDPYNLEQNVEGGARYIAMMKNDRKGDVPLALASYNWGPGNVNKELKRLGATSWDQVVAKGGGNKETNDYVKKIMGYFEEFKGSAGSCAGAGAGGGAADGTMSVKYNAENEGKVTAQLLDSYLGGTLKGLGQAYVEYGKQYGIEPTFLAAISRHETANGTSDLSKDSRHNLGGIKCPSKANKEKFGIKCSSGEYATFASLEKSLEYKAYLIKTSYVDKGKDTVGSIQKTYCPDGDGQCGVWVKNVTGYMNDIYGKAGVEVKGDPPKLDDTTEGEGVDDEGDKEDGSGDAGAEAGGGEGSELGKKMAAGALEMWKKYSKDLGVADPIYYEFAGGRSSKTAVVDTRRGDCSAFTAYVARTYGGVSINMTAATQGKNGKIIFDANMLQPGDLVLFKAGSGYQGAVWTDPNGKSHKISHVGMYVGNGEYVHLHGPSLSKSSKASAGTISKNKTTESYFRGHFVAGVRIGESGQVGEPGQIAAGEDSTDEAILHLQTLIQIDQYALTGLDLTDENIEKEYKGTNVYKMWKLAKKLDRKGEKNWTNYDYIMDARALVYECYLVGNEQGWFFKSKPCNEIKEEFPIADEHQAVLTHTAEHISHWWKCTPKASSASAAGGKEGPIVVDALGSGDAKAILTNHLVTEDPAPKNPCGKNETGEIQDKTVTSIAYPDLKQILAMFEPYSLAQNKATIIDKDESYIGLLNFYLQDGYEEAGVSGNYTDVAQEADATKLGKGAIAYPIENGKDHITDKFGTRGGKHKGMDFANGRGTKIVAVAAGTVSEVRTGKNGSNGYGNVVIIKHMIDGKEYYSKYAHLLNNEQDCPKCKDGGSYPDRKLSDYYDAEKKIQVKVGDQVTRGQVIAFMGNAGRSSNFHLHFELCSEPWETSTCTNPQPLFDE